MTKNISLISELINKIGTGANITLVTTVVSAYAIFLAALYLYSYWNSFKLNVFEYLSLGDLVTHAMPIFLTLLFMFMALPYLEFNLPQLYLHLLGLFSHLGRFQHLIELVLILFLSILFIVLQIWWIEILIAIIILIILLILLNTGYDAYSVATLIIFIPIYPVVKGNAQASKVKRGKKVLLVDLSKSVLQLPVDQHHQVSYIGRLRDVFILYESASDRLIIVPADKFESLVLVPADPNLTKKIIPSRRLRLWNRVP